MGAAAIVIIIVIVVLSIVLGVYFSKKRCPKFGYKCPAPVVTPPPADVTPPAAVPDVTPPAAVPDVTPPPAVGKKSPGMAPEMGGRKTAAMGGKVEQAAASGREVQDTRYMTNDELLASKKEQADLRYADGPALTNDQLAQLQRDAGKKVEITRDPALGQRINQMAGQGMGGKFEQAGQATMIEMGGKKEGIKGINFNKQAGGKIADAKMATSVEDQYKAGQPLKLAMTAEDQAQMGQMMGGKYKVDGAGQASFAADKNAEVMKKMGFGGPTMRVNNKALMGGGGM